MRRPKLIWTAALTAVGLSALPAPAQQPSQRGFPALSTVYPNTISQGGPGADVDPSTLSDLNADPLMTGRAARSILHNGLDYLNYREYDRALGFFRVAEKRQAELNDAERLQLRKGIVLAQQGKREAINGPHVVAQPKGRPTAPPGSYALAPSRPAGRPSLAATATTRGRATQPMAPEPVQLTSATAVEPTEPEPTPAATPMPNPGPAVVAGVPSEPPPLDLPAIVAPAPDPARDLPAIPAAPSQPMPDLGSPPPGGAALPTLPDAPTSIPDLPAIVPMPDSAPLPEPGPTAAPTPEPAPALDASTRPAEAIMPEAAPLPAVAEPAPVPAQDPMPMPMPAQTPAEVSRPPVEPPPVAEASAPAAPSGPVGVDLGRAAPDTGPGVRGLFSDSLLSPHNRAEIERLAQRSTDNPASDRAAAASPTGDSSNPNGVGQGSTRLEIQRAPSPTEARPIRKIPVPEEFTSLPPREWSASRKYFAAAATCHMTLYFQDPTLERYGQNVEQALGTRGRYFSYPLDDPRQSNQRNQILQPFWSIGKFAYQVGTLPYKLVVDPPWESEYDLGYYRPGDRIPRDTTVIFPTGVGPPGVGRRY